MPYALKGIDVALFSVFKSLGLKVSVRPVLDPIEFHDYDKSRYDQYESSFYKWDWHTGDRKYHDLGKWENRLTKEEFARKRGLRTRAGKDFHPIKLSEVGANDEGWEEIMKVS